MVYTSVIGIRPSEQNRLPINQTQATDRKGEGDSVRTQISVERASNAACNWRGKIEGSYIGTGSLKVTQISGKAAAGYIRENNNLCGGCAVAPLLTDVSDIERADRRSGIVFVRRIPQKKSPAVALFEPTEPSARSLLVPVP